MAGEPECGVGGTRMVSTPQTSGVRRVLVPGLIFRFVQVGVSPARCELCVCSPDLGVPLPPAGPRSVPSSWALEPPWKLRGSPRSGTWEDGEG